MHYSNILGLLTVLKSVNGNKGLYGNGAYISLIFQCSPDETQWNPGIVMAVFPDSTAFHPGYILIMSLAA